jgi:hypothetical protein
MKVLKYEKGRRKRKKGRKERKNSLESKRHIPK